MITGVMDINTDSSCSGTTNPAMVLFSSLGLDIIMGPDGSTEHSDLYGPGSSMNMTSSVSSDPGYLQGLWC